jgi:nitrile hydratase
VQGVHDLGGQQGFGPVEVEVDEPVWHEDWEGHAFSMSAAVMMQGWFPGQSRHSIERMEPGHYLTSSYYEHWFTGVATLLVESGRIDLDDLEARAGGVVPLALALTADPAEVDPAPTAPRFAVGDRVRVRRIGFSGHTRCPGYVMGHAGTVVRDDGPANVAEVEAHLGQLVQETVYSVRFAAADLWPECTDDTVTVHVDLYERYLDPVED